MQALRMNRTSMTRTSSHQHHRSLQYHVCATVWFAHATCTLTEWQSSSRLVQALKRSYPSTGDDV